MESTIKIGEIETTMIDGVGSTEELKVLLRWGWGAEVTGKFAFKPSEELKVGDGLRVVIEKVITIPDPVEEKVEEAPEAIVENLEAGEEKTGEIIEKTETAVETPIETLTNTKTV